MRRWIPVAALLCALCLRAEAGPNAHGTVTLHWNPGVEFTDDAYYPDGGLSDCDLSRVEAPPATGPFPLAAGDFSQKRIWFAYAVFPEGSSPRLRGVAFGIGYDGFDGSAGVNLLWTGPPPSSTEIRTAWPAWPGPNSGTSLVLVATLTARVNEVYVFAGYGTQGEIFSLRTHPSNPSQFVDDSMPPLLDNIEGFGTLGFGVPGQAACSAVTPVGACCFSDGTCRYIVQSLCHTGDWREATACTPNPCPKPMGACCNLATGGCSLRTEEGCDQQSYPHQWMGPGTLCGPNACPAPVLGACCFPDGSCQERIQEYCSTGDWREGTCSPNPCPLPADAGACCDLSEGSCVLLTEEACNNASYPHLWLGLDTACTPGACPRPPGPNEGGTLILHYHNSLSATCDPEAFHGLLDRCEDAVLEAPAASSFPIPCSEAQVWYAYAAFPEGSSPRLRGYTFGISYTPFSGSEGVRIEDSQSPPGSVEIRTIQPAWPLPGSGTSVVLSQTSTAPVEPVYSFTGYGSPGQVISLIDHPSGRALFGDDSVPGHLSNVAGFGSLGFGVSGMPACPVGVPGACCFPDGRCGIHTEVECHALGGGWLGPEIACTPNPCPTGQPYGACCFTDGHCVYVVEASCPHHGTWMPDTPCTPNPCAQPVEGACCGEDGACVWTDEPRCQTGDWRLGVPCQPNPCVQLPQGACCNLVTGGCSVMSEISCNGQFYPHEWMGQDTDCQPNPCSSTVEGACCSYEGVCTWVLGSQCQGNFYPYAPCEPNPCAPPPTVGACCYPDGACLFVSQDQCPTGDWRGGIVCSPNPCPMPPPYGACCDPQTGGCTYTSRPDCNQQVWIEGMPCTPNPCPAPPQKLGACCHVMTGVCGACTIKVESECLEQHIFLGPGTTCDPYPCPQPEGACCSPNGACSIQPRQTCLELDWRWIGGACTPNPCPQTGGKGYRPS